ncbi:MAG TPA: hypothetical protein ENG16_04030 [Archaeoglobus sp.]|nr:hypothetical protein [Archaeoglobus sp.]
MKRFLNKIPLLFLTPLRSLRRKIYLASVKKSFETAKFCILVNNFKIEESLRRLFKNKYFAQDDEYIQNLAWAVRLRLLYSDQVENVPQELRPFWEEHKEIIEREAREALGNASCKQLVAQTLLLRAYAFSRVNEEEAENYLKKAKLTDSSAEPLDPKSFKKIFEKLRREVKNRQEQEEIEKALKFDIFREVKTIATVVPVVFFISGLVYNLIYLGSFGIGLSKFFTLNDYIATTIDQFFVKALILGGSFALGCWSYKVERSSKAEKVETWFHKFADYLPVIIIIALTGILALYFDLRDAYWLFVMGLSILCFELFLGLLLKLSFKYAREPLRVFFYANILILFFLNVTFYAKYQAERIIKSDLSDVKKYHVVFADDVKLDESKLVLLSSTRDYHFFYSKENGNTYIIPSRLVISIIKAKNKGK